MCDNPYVKAKIKSFKSLRDLGDDKLNEIIDRVEAGRMNIPLIGVQSLEDSSGNIEYVHVDNCYNVPGLSDRFRRDMEVIVVGEDTGDNKALETFFRNL